ncbi:MAG: hypothetical protein WD689_00650 [Gaiellaceae bacterium]
MGVADNETMTFINQTYQRADAFLFGITIQVYRPTGRTEYATATGDPGAQR